MRHEENFLSSCLRKETEGKAEERETMNSEAKEEGGKSGKRELEGEKKILAAVCQRVCCVRVVISYVNLVREMDFPSVSVLVCELVEPQTSSFSRTRGASVALECEHHKRTKASMKAAPCQSVPKNTPVKAVPESVRNKEAPPPPKGTPLQHTITWLGPPSAPRQNSQKQNTSVVMSVRM